MRRFAPLAPWILVTAAACTQGGDGDFDFEGQTAATAAVTMTSSATSSATSSGTDITGTDQTTDVPTTTTGPEPSSDTSGNADESTTEVVPTEPCTSLDVLVVVDNSDTMAEEQARLNAALNPFLAQLNQQLPGVLGSIHIAVITTDVPEFVTETPAATCTPYASAANWMSFGPMLSVELACAVAVGTAGDPDERPMQMAIEALSSELTGPAGFNEGFLREQGPLLLIIATDEEDDFEVETEWGSVGDPAAWVDALAATQSDHVQDVIPLVLVGIDKPNACPDYQWNGLDGAQLAPRLAEFATSFPHHGVGDLCAVEYTTFLNAALPEVVEACNAWVPE